MAGIGGRGLPKLGVDTSLRPQHLPIYMITILFLRGYFFSGEKVLVFIDVKTLKENHPILWLNLVSTESLVSMCFLLTYLLHVTGVVEYRSLTDLVHQMSLRIHSVESINYWENLFN